MCCTRHWHFSCPVAIHLLPLTAGVKTGSSRSGMMKEGSVIVSGCQQRARAMKLRYVVWWWWLRERKPTGFGNGFRHCLASISTSRPGSEANPKGSGSGKRRDRETKNRDTGSILVDCQTEELRTRVQLLILRAERETYWDRL